MYRRYHVPYLPGNDVSDAGGDRFLCSVCQPSSERTWNTAHELDKRARSDPRRADAFPDVRGQQRSGLLLKAGVPGVVNVSTHPASHISTFPINRHGIYSVVCMNELR